MKDVEYQGYIVYVYGTEYIHWYYSYECDNLGPSEN